MRSPWLGCATPRGQLSSWWRVLAQQWGPGSCQQRDPASQKTAPGWDSAAGIALCPLRLLHSLTPRTGELLGVPHPFLGSTQLQRGCCHPTGGTKPPGATDSQAPASQQVPPAVPVSPSPACPRSWHSSSSCSATSEADFRCEAALASGTLKPRWGKPAGEKAAARGLAQDVVAWPGGKWGWRGSWGPETPPPRTGQNRLQPWGRDYAEPEACPAASPVLHDLTTTCLRRGRKRGNSTFFQE